MEWGWLILLVMTAEGRRARAATQMFSVYWNSSNPNFRQETSDYVMEVNKDNEPWEYDQVNIICPQYEKGEPDIERHIIYSVTKEEFDACKITTSRPKIVAICDKPHQLTYFTLTFRSFTPSPRQLEFTPGKSYYFISTANNKDIHRRVGGWCSSHNMKLVFRVAGPQHGSVNSRREKDSEEEGEELRARLRDDRTSGLDLPGRPLDPRTYYRPARGESPRRSDAGGGEAFGAYPRRASVTDQASGGSAQPLTSSTSSAVYRPWVVWSSTLLVCNLMYAVN